MADVAGQLDAARTEGGVVGGNPERVEEIKGRFTYRMYFDGEDAEASGEVFYGRCGDRKQGIRQRGVKGERSILMLFPTVP